jgi:hypothetical protein
MTASKRHLAVGACLAVAQALILVPGATAASPGEVPAGSSASSPVAASATPVPTTTPPPGTTVVLSNERTFTTWAHPVEEVSIREQPLPRSRRIARTHLETEDGFPEVYMVLASFTDARGSGWVRVRIPGRPNGRIGWVPRSALGEFHVTYWLLEISLGRHRLRAYDEGKLRFTAPVGVGKPSTPTPTGRFWIRERFKVSNRSNPYWPYALGTSDYSTLTEWPGGGVVGIHGDLGEPRLIPGDPSHGCVRMRDSDIGWLAPRVPIGTPVRITL